MNEVLAKASPKFCINCRHIGTNSSQDASRYRCFAPQNLVRKGFDLVTGNCADEYRYPDCYTARLDHAEDSCGTEAKWFEGRSKPVFPSAAPSTAYSTGSQVTTLLNQLSSMK